MKKENEGVVTLLEACGWQTQLIERRHHRDIAITDEDPPSLLSGLDRLKPRLTLARDGFSFMLDAGVGHDPGDFEGTQLCAIANGHPMEGLWSAPDPTGEDGAKNLLNRATYLELGRHVGQCGTVEFAEASAAVPFVGAATGSLMIAQATRLASLEVVPAFLQVELNAPGNGNFRRVKNTSENHPVRFSMQLGKFISPSGKG